MSYVLSNGSTVDHPLELFNEINLKLKNHESSLWKDHHRITRVLVMGILTIPLKAITPLQDIRNKAYGGFQPP